MGSYLMWMLDIIDIAVDLFANTKDTLLSPSRCKTVYETLKRWHSHVAAIKPSFRLNFIYFGLMSQRGREEFSNAGWVRRGKKTITTDRSHHTSVNDSPGWKQFIQPHCPSTWSGPLCCCCCSGMVGNCAPPPPHPSNPLPQMNHQMLAGSKVDCSVSW